MDVDDYRSSDNPPRYPAEGRPDLHHPREHPLGHADDQHQYRKLRQRAGVSDDVKCAHCRDGAYTAAIDSGATVDEAKFLAGHAIGISDHYLKRKPTMVAGAVEGIRKAYFCRDRTS